jgi:FkbM family methyltransferase
VVVNLPWSLPITVNPHEAIGYQIRAQGLYEPLVTESLWRLAEIGEVAADVGANIGHMASVLAVRVGHKGRLLCFEPHPEVFSCLRDNVAVWERNPRCAQFDLHPVAVGAQDGSAWLRTNDWFATNKGTAWVGGERPGGHPKAAPVRVIQLDTVLAQNAKIGVLKIDVEGCELDVFRGMSRLLAEHAVRDIVFEELTPFPAPTHQFLQANGYSIFGLEERFWGVRIRANASPWLGRLSGPVPNYLATCDPQRARRLFAAPGWRSFGWM